MGYSYIITLDQGSVPESNTTMPSVSSGNETEKDNDKEEVDEKRCDGDNDNEDNIDSIGQKLASLSIAQAPKSQTPIEALADKMSSNEFKNVVVLNGAGISVSAGEVISIQCFEFSISLCDRTGVC